MRCFNVAMVREADDDTEHFLTSPTGSAAAAAVEAVEADVIADIRAGTTQHSNRLYTAIHR